MFGLQRFFKGGPESGNHGHAGRPGRLGGSAPGHGGGGKPDEKPRKPKEEINIPVTNAPFETGRIMHTHSSFGSSGGHVNQTYLVDIENDGKGIAKAEQDEKKNENVQDFANAVKRVTGTDFGKCSQTQREVLSSEVDKILGVGLVPDTVFKDIPNHGKGSVQEFKKGLKKLDWNEAREGKYNDQWEQFVKGAVFDRMIGSCDRHGHNVYFQGDKLCFIDNGYTFAKNYEKAWNGDFTRMQSEIISKIEVNGRPPTRFFQALPEYQETGKAMASKALENGKLITKLFRGHGLPTAERKSFWKRVEELHNGKVEEDI